MGAWVPVRLAAEELSVSENTIRRMIRDGQIESLRVRGAVRVRIPDGGRQEKQQGRAKYKPKVLK